MSKIKNLISRLSSVALLIATMLPLTALAETPVSATTSTTMQGFDDSMCAAMSTGDSATLTDTRDNKSYTIKKLADDHCWMTQNLRLTGEKTLTPSDSDVSDNWTLPASTEAYDNTAGAIAWCDDWDSSECDNRANVLDTGNTSYGAYYSWAAATAGTGTYSVESGNASSSICPKGWRLPTGGSSGELNTLYTSYGSSATNLLSETGPALVLSGLRYGEASSTEGENGYYWSSTANNANSAYFLALDSFDVYPATNNAKYIGYSVRCILDNPPTPGETTVTANIEEVLSLSLYSSGSLGDKTYTCNTQNDPVCSGQQQIARTTLLPSQEDKSTMYTIATINTNSINGYDLTIGDSDTVNALTATSGSTTIGTIGAIGSEPVGGTNPGWAIAIDKDDQGWSGTWYQVPISTATPLTIKSNHPTPAAVTINSQTKVTYGVAATSTQPTGTYTDTVVFTATTGV